MSYKDGTTTRKKIEVLTSDFEWYIRTHTVDGDGNHTGFSGTMAMLLHSYREVCEEGGSDMVSMTLKAAKNYKETL